MFSSNVEFAFYTAFVEPTIPLDAYPGKCDKLHSPMLGYATTTTTLHTDSKYISITCYAIHLNPALAQETNPVNLIYGIPSHIDPYEQERTTSGHPIISLHPLICEFSLNELRRGLPLPLLQIKCQAEAVRFSCASPVV
jgi:hypothetical protein